MNSILKDSDHDRAFKWKLENSSLFSPNLWKAETLEGCDLKDMRLDQISIPHSPDLEVLARRPEMNSVTSLFSTKSPISVLAHELDTSLVVDTPRYAFI